MNSVYASYYGQGQRLAAPLTQRTNRTDLMPPPRLFGGVSPGVTIPKVGMPQNLWGWEPWLMGQRNQQFVARRNIRDLQGQGGVPNLAPFRPEAAPYIPPQLQPRIGGQYPGFIPTPDGRINRTFQFPQLQQRVTNPYADPTQMIPY